jgi:hypothetical protein
VSEFIYRQPFFEKRLLLAPIEQVRKSETYHPSCSVDSHSCVLRMMRYHAGLGCWKCLLATFPCENVLRSFYGND